ncbi:extracellular solute-binding protein [Streptomyces sp. RKAG290]|uniref:ABC transporter substrate-binding protein n=1 Tax=unclassified Streptomyces TaxID=2593676 RepID=UPI0020334BBD|nr:extracellular solute-binding protein [Streptomyces sp. RKAG290]MCM2416023.1 extracellular solute-binding protein [Streptomyces sp. RKAG290]
MRSAWVRGAGALLATAALVVTSACSADSGSDKTAAESGGKANLTFWGWAPGYDKSVAAFNAAHPNIKVTFQKTASGSAGGYSKMLNAVKAGNAPCLAQVGYESLPSFAAAGALENVAKYADAVKGKYVGWTWKAVSVQDQVYGIPLDTGPEAMFYRADVLKKFKQPVPTTWKQFAEVGKAIHKADPDVHLATPPSDGYDFAGLTWQAGGRWFGTEGDSWQVSIDNPQSRKVAAYWQDLHDAKVLKNTPALDTAWIADADKGNIVSYVGAVWANALLSQNLKASAGKWAVAPMPQWEEGGKAAGNNGGSSTAVLKGCKNPKEAVEFADWFSSNTQSAENLIKNTGIYPAATDALSLPAVNQSSEFFGGQNIYDVFKEAAANTDTNWQWGPTMTQVEADFTDGMKKANSGGGSFADALTGTQSKTLSAMKAQGLTASGS